MNKVTWSRQELIDHAAMLASDVVITAHRKRRGDARQALRRLLDTILCLEEGLCLCTTKSWQCPVHAFEPNRAHIRKVLLDEVMQHTAEA